MQIAQGWATSPLIAETLALRITVKPMVAAIAVGIAAPVLLFVPPNVQRTTTFPQGRE